MQQAIKSRVREIVLVLAIIVIGFAATMVNGNFLSVQNFSNILNIASTMGIMAIGMTLIITTGNIDVSVGAQYYACSVVAGVLCSHWDGGNVPMIFLITIAVGLGIGFANGLLVTMLRMPAIVVTLAMMSIVRGVALVANEGTMISNLTGDFVHVANIKFGALYITPLIWIICSLAVFFIIYKVRIGREILALGGNPTAAERIGIDKRRLYIFVFSLAGALVGLASTFYVSKTGLVHAQLGVGYEMKVIAAVVIGGTAFSGGKISLAGTFCGVILLGVMDNMLTLMRVPLFWQSMTTGAVLLLAVVSSAFTTDAAQERAKYKPKKVAKIDGGA